MAEPRTFYCTGCGQVVNANSGDSCPNCPGPLGFGTHRRSTTDAQLREILAPARSAAEEGNDANG